MHETVTKVEAAVLAALTQQSGGDAIDARALQLLLRRYQTGACALGDLVEETLGRALATALDEYANDQTVSGRAAWVELFVEASTLSNDERLIAAIGDLVASARQTWHAPRLEDQCTALGASLHAAGLDPFRAGAADAIDTLERVVGRVYEPGEHIGSTAAQVAAASALLVAYSLSGRLPYSMLAEELMQNSVHDLSIDFATACAAARVFCRLAALHDDPDYRAAAIVAPGADYRRDAARLLDAHAAEALRRGAAGAIYALAQLELESGL